MLDKEVLCDMLNSSSLNQKDCCLVILAFQIEKPKSKKSIVEIGTSCGLSEIVKWNIPRAIKGSNGLAYRVDNKWQLTKRGKIYLEDLLSPFVKSPIVKTTISLREHLLKINNAKTQDFVGESVRCFEYGLLRSAVVLSWVGAISCLCDYVFTNCLMEFNHEAINQKKIKKPIKMREDFSRIKEYDCLQLMSSVSLFSKSVKNELEARLKLRNGCGHPNELVVSEHKVASHIESLIDNVFARFY